MDHTSVLWKTVLRNSTTLAQINFGGSSTKRKSDDPELMGIIRMMGDPLLLATAETHNVTHGKSKPRIRVKVPLGLHNFNFFTY